MPEDRRKMYSKRGTGTVPKIKYRNNTPLLNHDDHNIVSNNLGRDGNHPNFSRVFRNPGTNTPPLSQYLFVMEPLIDEQNSITGQNGVSCTTNGSVSTPNTSESISRRNSLGTVPKCDNVTKYPDKKQIEDKLNQIREYLCITSSLMSNMKNADDQLPCYPEKEQLEKSYNDLKDSELKLESMLSDIDDNDKCQIEEIEVTENGVENAFGTPKLSKNVLERKVEHANQELEMLREQENLLLNLQLKAENQLREARHAQQKLLTHQNSNSVNQLRGIDEINSDHSNRLIDLNDTVPHLSIKNFNENQEIINELDERLKLLKTDLPQPSRMSSASNVQEQFLSQVEALQQKINHLRDSNDNRNQLIHILDKRDAHLQTEHMELQTKLLELQNKKMQVDQLVSQLQNMNEESEEEDVGSQVRKIVSMKEQLSKLKDMLVVVKDTEDILESQNINESDLEIQENAHSLSAKTDNLIQNDVRSNHLGHTENVNSRIENNPSHSSNERRVKEKQVNKKSMNANERERLKLQAELQSKKRELEELMCKHKAASSNLNQDVHCENKSDATSNSLYEGTTNSWYPMPSNLYHLPNSSERYSSDDCPEDDMNEYSELNSSGEVSNVHMVQPMPALSYPTSNYTKHKEAEPRLEIPPGTHNRGPSRTPEHNARCTSASETGLQRERLRAAAHDTQKSQIQKQLELIRQVCDSMLEQNNSSNQYGTTQNLRNNLTPSPLYSEPRQFSSPNPHAMNALNIVNPPPDSTWLPTGLNQQNFSLNDPSNYQNWLTTNTLQTQAFMLNTLNQCCQMLWLQQRELSNLRHTVSSLQERVQDAPIDQNNTISYINTNPCIYPSVPTQESQGSSQIRMLNNPKMNQVSSTASLPNLNQPHVSQTNIEPAYANHNNVHNARVLESGLNNTVHQNTVGEHINNTVLHGVNQSLPSQIWNGPALNNQVAPGNRANNYWDNFRSYSRQNLLSTKSNEGLQNQSIPTERPNNTSERCHTYSYPTLTTQKQNTEQHDSSNSSIENTPRRRMLFKSPRHSVNTDNVSTVPPDVLNLNDGSTHKTSTTTDLLEMSLPILNQSGDRGELNFQPFVNTFMHADSSAPQSNISGSQGCKDCPPSNQRNRNEWHDDSQADTILPKSKLFDELRENVYKEVASLISANQGRPHFLIQLFRDLQLVSSDPMRRRTLQSIQSLISHSLESAGNIQGTLRQTSSAHSLGIENDVIANCSSFFEIPPHLCVLHRPANIETDNSLEPDCHEHLSEVLTFLNTHCDDVLQQNLLESLKELLVESTFSTLFTNVKDGIIQKHFACLVMEALEQYRGKRIRDVRLNILQTIEDLLRGEISLIRLMRENVTENYEMNSLINNESGDPQANQSSLAFDLQLVNSGCNVDDINNPPQMQNGDLAEADQSRLELDDEEGAVGGVLNILAECTSNTPQIGQDEIELPKIEYPVSAESDVEFTEQGLDQVPTRLTTHSRSHSNTPNRDRSNSSRTDVSEQF